MGGKGGWVWMGGKGGWMGGWLVTIDNVDMMRVRINDIC